MWGRIVSSGWSPSPTSLYVLVEFVVLNNELVSPETKEAIKKGIEKIDEIPEFYLKEEEKKETMEKDAPKLAVFGSYHG